MWPEVPEDLEKWDKKQRDEGKRERERLKENRTQQGTELGVVPELERRTLREQARSLLGGSSRWTPGIMEEAGGNGRSAARM